MLNGIKVAASVLALIAASASSAQVLDGRWASGARTYKINVNVSQRGDTVTNTAASRWSSVTGANIRLTNGGTESVRDPIGASNTAADAGKSTIEDRAPIVVNGVEATAWVERQIYADGTMYDADMFLNRNIINANRFFYEAGAVPATADQFHYYSVMLHELGHVIGFADQYTNTACVTHGNLDVRQVRTTFCGPETAALAATY